MKNKLTLLLFSFLILPIVFVHGQKANGIISFTISMENPAKHYFHVEMQCDGIKKDNLNLKMPVWSPGYYQRLDFANNVENFHATNSKGDEIKWSKISGNT